MICVIPQNLHHGLSPRLATSLGSPRSLWKQLCHVSAPPGIPVLLSCREQGQAESLLISDPKARSGMGLSKAALVLWLSPFDGLWGRNWEGVGDGAGDSTEQLFLIQTGTRDSIQKAQSSCEPPLGPGQHFPSEERVKRELK